MKRVLLIDCSPKDNGNTAHLVKIFKKNATANITHVKVFPQLNKDMGILPCIDCGGCMKVDRCVLNDNFAKIVDDVYDVVVLASPIYMSNLPGPAFNLISRFNYLFNNKEYLKLVHNPSYKRAVLMLVGGGFASKKLQGKTNEELAIKQAGYIFGKLNAELKEDDIITCLNTDFVKIEENKPAQEKVIKLAKGL